MLQMHDILVFTFLSVKDEFRRTKTDKTSRNCDIGVIHAGPNYRCAINRSHESVEVKFELAKAKFAASSEKVWGEQEQFKCIFSDEH